MICYINGKYMGEEDAKISIFDLAFLRGFAVFENLRTYQKKPFHLKEHLERLYFSAEQIGLEPSHSFEEITQIVETLLDMTPDLESGIKIFLTGGISPDQFTPQTKGNLIAFTYPLPLLPSEYFENGITAVTTMLSRSQPLAKTTQYTSAVLALKQGTSIGAKEALYLSQSGEVLEGTTSSFFGVKENALYTCSSEEVLLGITQEVVIRLAEENYEVKRQGIFKEEIGSLSEAFITSSNREIIPVSKIDDQIIGQGKVGPVTRKMIRLFRSYTKGEDWSPLSIPRYMLEGARELN